MARLKAGDAIEVACPLAGISVATFYVWMRRGRNEKSGLFLEFVEAIKKALATAESESVSIVRKAGVKNWTAAAWWLERRYPERYGRREVLEIRKLAKQLKKLESRLNASGD